METLKYLQSCPFTPRLLAYDPENLAIYMNYIEGKPKKSFETIKQLRSNNFPTLPTILEEELKSNIFLRCDQNDIKAKLNMKNQEDFKVFRKVRELKDSF